MRQSSVEAPRLRRGVLMAAALAAVLMQFAGSAIAAQAPKQRTTEPVEETRLSNIRDAAGLFSAEAVAAAREALRNIESKTTVATMIATAETLKGASIENEAEQMAKESGIEGIFILISKAEKRIQVLVSKKFLTEMMKRQRDLIRTHFTAGFRHGNFDEGLKNGVAEIAESLLRAQRAGELLARTATGASASPAGSAAGSLVLRNQVRLTLAGARVLIAAAEEKAQSLKLKVNVAIVDDGGHLIAFERMDGARPASGYTAMTKATSAATFRQPSGPLNAGKSIADPLLNLSLQNAAEASGGKITALYGGVPVVVDAQVIGAIGIGGGTGEQDTEIATAGVRALLSQLGGEVKEPAKTAETPR
jgi:uncharacterized protein GlcG (DUF336 family)